MEAEKILAAVRGIEHVISSYQSGWTNEEAKMRVGSFVKQMLDSSAVTSYIRGKAGRIVEFSEALFRDQADARPGLVEDLTASILE